MMVIIMILIMIKIIMIRIINIKNRIIIRYFFNFIL